MSRLVYILGASHSGSTLLAMLLNAHPEICSVGELKATSLGDVDRYRCSCGYLIKQCPFWARVSEAMVSRGFAFDITDAGTDLLSGRTPYARRLLRPLHRGPVLEWFRDAALSCSLEWRRALPQIQARNLALVQSLLEITDTRIVVDSSKTGLRLKYLLRIPGLDVRVIHLLRDGRAVAATHTSPHELADACDPARRGGGNGDTTERNWSIYVGAREWRRSNEEAEQILRLLPSDRWTRVRYEEYCADPARVLRRLACFLEIGGTYRHEAFRERARHMIGNGMRFDSSAAISLDERWRDVLSKAELAAFDRLAGSLNRAYGYK